MNGYVLLADLVAVFHSAYIFFVVGGFALIVVGAARGWQWIRAFWFIVAHFAAIRPSIDLRSFCGPTVDHPSTTLFRADEPAERRPRLFQSGNFGGARTNASALEAEYHINYREELRRVVPEDQPIHPVIHKAAGIFDFTTRRSQSALEIGQRAPSTHEFFGAYEHNRLHRAR